MRLCLAGLIAIALLATAVEAAPRATLNLPSVTHYELPPLPPITPVKPPLYTEKQESKDGTANNRNDDENWYKTFWRWFMGTYRRTIADPIAFFTLVLATSTIGLWIATWVSGVRQSRDMQKSIKVSERSFTEIERALIAGAHFQVANMSITKYMITMT